MIVESAPFSDMRTRFLPSKSRSLFPAPVYVPLATSTVSSSKAELMASWIVTYPEGTRSVRVVQEVPSGGPISWPHGLLAARQGDAVESE